jgi:hypothetical protein
VVAIFAHEARLQLVHGQMALRDDLVVLRVVSAVV